MKKNSTNFWDIVVLSLIVILMLSVFAYSVRRERKAQQGDTVILIIVNVKKLNSHFHKAEITYKFYYKSRIYKETFTRPNVFNVDKYLNKCFIMKIEKNDIMNRSWSSESPCECPPELLQAIDSANRAAAPPPPPTAVPERPLEDIPENNTYWPANR